MNLAITTNYSTPSFGIKTDKKLVNQATKAVAGSTIVTGGAMTVNELVNRAKVMSDNQNVQETEMSISSLIDIATIKDKRNDEQLKAMFNKILTEIESRPDIEKIIKRNDSEFLPEDEFDTYVTYRKKITLSDGRNVVYEHQKAGRNFSTSKVYLYPGSDGLSGHDYINSFEITCDKGKSSWGWSFTTYNNRGITYNMAHKDDKPDYTSPVSR